MNQSGRWGPYRQASPSPARHRPGARSARRQRCLSIISQTNLEKEIAMWFRNLFDALKTQRSRTPIQQARRRPARRQPAPCRIAVEALEDRYVPAAMLSVQSAVILEGNAGTQNAAVTVTLSEPHG